MHSICGNNQQSGNCGLECSDYLESKCTISDEIVLTLKGEELEEHYELYPNDRPKRRIVLSGVTVELHDWANFVTCDGDGTWKECRREPYIAFAPCTWASLGLYSHLMDGPANESWRESLIDLNKPESTKRTIVLDGHTVDIPDHANFISLNPSGSWWAFSNEPKIIESQIAWRQRGGKGDLLLSGCKHDDKWKDSLIDLNNLPESNPKAWTDNQARMLANDEKPVDFIAKTPPATVYLHTCTDCGKPCNMTNRATVCDRCAP